MHLLRDISLAALTVTLLGSLVTSSCSRRVRDAGHTGADSTKPTSEGLVLQMDEGERRFRRPPPSQLANLTAPSIIKVDRQNGGSPELVMVYTEIPPGQGIQPHHHPDTDEILFVHRGSGVAQAGSRSATIEAGSGFEDYLRAISVLEGQKAEPLSVGDLTAIRARHRHHVIFHQADGRADGR